MSSRVRALLVASTLSVAVAVGMWMLGGGGAATHSPTPADAPDRAVMQRTVAGAAKVALRLPFAAMAPGGRHVTSADVFPVRAATLAPTIFGHARLYALLRVYRL